MNALKVKTKKRVTFLLPSESDENCILSKPVKESPVLEEISFPSAYQLSNSSTESISRTESLSPGLSVSPILSLSSEEQLHSSSNSPPMQRAKAASHQGYSLYAQENLSIEDSIQNTILFSKSHIPSPQTSSSTPRYSTSTADLASSMSIEPEDSPYCFKSISSNNLKHHYSYDQSYANISQSDDSHSYMPCDSGLQNQLCDAPSQFSGPLRCKQFGIVFKNNSVPHIQLLERAYNHFLDVAPSNSNAYTFSSMRFVIMSTLSLNKSLKEFASLSFPDVKSKMTATRALQDSDDQLRSLTEYLLGITSPSVVSKSVSPSSTNSSVSSSRSTSYRHVADIFPPTPSNKAGCSSPYGSRSLGSSSPSPRYGSFQGPSSGLGMSTKGHSKQIHRHQSSAYGYSYRDSNLIDRVSSERQELASSPISKNTSDEQIYCHQPSTPVHNYRDSPPNADLKPEYHRLVGGQRAKSGSFSKGYSRKCSVQSDVPTPPRHQTSYQHSSLSLVPSQSRDPNQPLKLKQPYRQSCNFE
ncbi:hypothetical protein DSO57_1027894 [Entomophthora muscae]|uniref:Uncharacterized protein n=1 Tax=Entomophthora muscae TaxID=34485 RepID=A0ACC2UBD8_9FUNG|nr:hypothetical protein DSO57_1027894 [Entomophthora muscae]